MAGAEVTAGVIRDQERCLMRFVTNAEKNARFLSDQLEANLFTAVIVLNPKAGREDQTGEEVDPTAAVLTIRADKLLRSWIY